MDMYEQPALHRNQKYQQHNYYMIRSFWNNVNLCLWSNQIIFKEYQSCQVSGPISLIRVSKDSFSGASILFYWTWGRQSSSEFDENVQTILLVPSSSSYSLLYLMNLVLITFGFMKACDSMSQLFFSSLTLSAVNTFRPWILVWAFLNSTSPRLFCIAQLF